MGSSTSVQNDEFGAVPAAKKRRVLVSASTTRADVGLCHGILGSSASRPARRRMRSRALAQRSGRAPGHSIGVMNVVTGCIVKRQGNQITAIVRAVAHTVFKGAMTVRANPARLASLAQVIEHLRGRDEPGCIVGTELQSHIELTAASGTCHGVCDQRFGPFARRNGRNADHSIGRTGVAPSRASRHRSRRSVVAARRDRLAGPTRLPRALTLAQNNNARHQTGHDHQKQREQAEQHMANIG